MEDVSFVERVKKEIEGRGLIWEYNPEQTEIVINTANNKEIGRIDITEDKVHFYSDRGVETYSLIPNVRGWLDKNGYYVEGQKVDYIGQEVFETICKENGFKCIKQDDGGILVYKNGDHWFNWYKGKASVFNELNVFHSRIGSLAELKDYMKQIDDSLKEHETTSQGCKSAIMKEMDDVTNTDTYHGVKGDMEPIKLMEHFIKEYAKRNIPVDKGMLLTGALKYLTRVGTKDDYETDIFNVINLATRALYGKWLPADFDKKMKED